jgi:hypothetical protein
VVSHLWCMCHRGLYAAGQGPVPGQQSVLCTTSGFDASMWCVLSLHTHTLFPPHKSLDWPPGAYRQVVASCLGPGVCDLLCLMGVGSRPQQHAAAHPLSRASRCSQRQCLGLAGNDQAGVTHASLQGVGECLQAPGKQLAEHTGHASLQHGIATADVY